MSDQPITPLQPGQQSLAEQLASSTSADQALWLSGYFAGFSFASKGGSVSAPAVAAPAAKQPMLVLYGTESGNAEALAGKAAKAANASGFKAKAVNMADSKPEDLAKAENLLVVVSTWGEGDPPDSATSYYETFMGDGMGKLEGLSYSVCALGDTSYEHFCKIGKDVDARLSALGASCVADRVDCDVDYEEAFDGWLKTSLGAFPQQSATVTAAGDAAVLATPTVVAYDKKNPFPAEVIEKVLLNGTGSQKEVYHLELSLEGSGLTYVPGDALGVYPVNRAKDLEAVLKATGLSANAKVGGKTLAESLETDFDITTLSASVAKKYLAITNDASLKTAMEADGGKSFKEWCQGRQLIDLLESYPFTGWSAETFSGILRKLNPRLYSIASSIKHHEEEVHLTIAAVRYETFGREREGVASCYVADDLKAGDRVRIFFHTNKNFRLPENGDTPIIMVGPGTGIAPFRSFVEERAANGDKGDNWLIFGDQRYSFDFLYQLEWQDYLSDGLLNRLDVAFSRDQKEKVYVQDRLRESGEQVYAWLEKGAHFYVCGDAAYMAKDVHQALLDIIAEQGNKSAEEAKAYIDQLKKDRRYQRDVY